MKYYLLALILLASCSFKKNNQTLKGHEELYSEPDTPDLISLNEHEKRIVIASTNDIHGLYSPVSFTFEDQHNKGTQSIVIGGESVMNTYFNILRDVYKNVILVDSGDIFSDGKDWKGVEEFYTKNRYDAVTVGLRDFNLKISEEIGNTTGLFQQFAKTSKTPLLLSNLYELKTARVVEWEGTRSHIIREVNGVKVGIIGLIPDDIVAQTPVNNRVGLFVENMLQSTLRHARLLRSLGADVIVVLTHQGIDCNSELAQTAKLPVDKVNFEPQRPNVCDLKNALGDYLLRLPPNLVDVVIGGRNHMKTANIVNDIVVMSGFPDGSSFSYTELVFDTKTKKLNKEKTVVHQPVYFCNEFFKETSDCYFKDPSVDHKKRIPAKFLGQDIFPDKTAALPAHKRLITADVVKSLETFHADLSYAPPGSGETQLIVLNLKGKELLKFLEEDYNRGRDAHWTPSPYSRKGNDLFITINGQNIQLERNYRVLTDLESAQKHSYFLRKVTSFDTEALVNHSWNSFEEDSVSSKLAAQAR